MPVVQWRMISEVLSGLRRGGTGRDEWNRRPSVNQMSQEADEELRDEGQKMRSTMADLTSNMRLVGQELCELKKQRGSQPKPLEEERHLLSSISPPPMEEEGPNVQGTFRQDRKIIIIIIIIIRLFKECLSKRKHFTSTL